VIQAEKKGIDEQTVVEFMRKLRGDILLDYLPEITGSKMGYYFKALQHNLKINEKRPRPMAAGP